MTQQAETLLTDILEELRVQNRHARLWDTKDVAWYFGVAPQTARNKLMCRADFPRPVNIPGLGRRWKPAEVKAYADRS